MTSPNGRPTIRPNSSAGTFFMNLRNAKWWGYVTGGVFLIYGLIRLWRKVF